MKCPLKSEYIDLQSFERLFDETTNFGEGHFMKSSILGMFWTLVSGHFGEVFWDTVLLCSFGL